MPGSVWLREARSYRDAPPLTRDRIVAAAVSLLDDEGVSRLTMRRLAERLGTGATTLYWHVQTKNDVIDLALDAIFGEVALPADPGTDWRAKVHALMIGWRAAMLRHPWSDALIGRPMLGPNVLRRTEFLHATLTSAGFAGTDLIAGAHAWPTTSSAQRSPSPPGSRSRHPTPRPPQTTTFANMPTHIRPSPRTSVLTTWMTRSTAGWTCSSPAWKKPARHHQRNRPLTLPLAGPRDRGRSRRPARHTMGPQQAGQRLGIRVWVAGSDDSREYDTTVPGSEFTDRFRTTLELYEVGENMLRQRLRRERPAASAQDIDGEIAAWLQRRPGAESGDHPGPPSLRRL